MPDLRGLFLRGYGSAEKRKELEHRPIARRTRTNLMKLTRQYEAEELHATRTQAKGGNWLAYQYYSLFNYTF
ncbi:hypothetical protein Defa_28780 [Desulfovibrio sp. TH_2024_36128]|uniref:Uncharacterized protein n=1 Tax=Desulfovibrio falkowii TaxID=3136602 RepID=A0ABQ0EC96_9BACT